MPILLNAPGQRKRPVANPADLHDFESVGSILRRMRGSAEAEMTETFSRPLSLTLEHLIAFEQRLIEEPGD
jgi:hypothetical protein